MMAKASPWYRRLGGGALPAILLLVLMLGIYAAYEPSALYSSVSLGKAALRNLTYSLAQELGASGVHVATVTVYGFVQPGTHFDPTRIAEAYVALHRQPKGHFQIEHVYR